MKCFLVTDRFVLVGIMAVTMLNGGTAKADCTYGTPTDLGLMMNSSHREGHLSITADGLMFYFASYRSGGSGNSEIWVKDSGELVSYPGACMTFDYWASLYSFNNPISKVLTYVM